MSLKQHIESANNVNTLRSQFRKKLTAEWSSIPASRIEGCIDMVLEDCIQKGIAPYASWAVTKENIDDVNLEIWKLVKTQVELKLKALEVDLNEASNNFLYMRGGYGDDMSRSSRDEDRSEGITSFRQLDSLQARHAAIWK